MMKLIPYLVCWCNNYDPLKIWCHVITGNRSEAQWGQLMVVVTSSNGFLTSDALIHCQHVYRTFQWQNQTEWHKFPVTTEISKKLSKIFKRILPNAKIVWLSEMFINLLPINYLLTPINTQVLKEGGQSQHCLHQPANNPHTNRKLITTDPLNTKERNNRDQFSFLNKYLFKIKKSKG